MHHATVNRLPRGGLFRPKTSVRRAFRLVYLLIPGMCRSAPGGRPCAAAGAAAVFQRGVALWSCCRPTVFTRRWSGAIGEVAEPFLVVDRGGVADLIMGPPAAASLDDLERLIAFVPACRLEQLGDPAFREAHRDAICLHGRGDGQRHRLGRDRRGDGPAGHARLLRRGGAPGRGRRARDRPDRPRPRGQVPVRLQPDPQPARAAPRGGGRRSLSAPRHPPGRGVGVSRPDPAAGALPGDGIHRDRRARS